MIENCSITRHASDRPRRRDLTDTAEFKRAISTNDIYDLSYKKKKKCKEDLYWDKVSSEVPTLSTFKYTSNYPSSIIVNDSGQ